MPSYQPNWNFLNLRQEIQARCALAAPIFPFPLTQWSFRDNAIPSKQNGAPGASSGSAIHSTGEAAASASVHELWQTLGSEGAAALPADWVGRAPAYESHGQCHRTFGRAHHRAVGAGSPAAGARELLRGKPAGDCSALTQQSDASGLHLPQPPRAIII